jgi:membrane-anchored protein YejM (alkaline phosphatase superfamily)
MKKILLLLAPLLAGLALFIVVFKRPGPDHIFLITLDTTRADHIDYSPTKNSLTPNLGRLAANGMYFENAYSIIPITLPSHATMFYSLPPHVFKIYNNGQERFVPYTSLAEIMKRNGYATGAVISLAVLNKNFGLNKGFDHYLENFSTGLWYKTAAEVNRDAFTLIEKLKDKKSFIWIHYSDPHEPYFPPGPQEKFTVRCGQQLLFNGPSIEQPVLRLILTLAPGTNIVRLNSEIPAFLRENQAFTAVSYTDLQIKPLDQDADIAMSFSPDMVSRSERYGLVTIISPKNESFLTVANKGTKPCRAELAFKYMLKIKDEVKSAGYEKEIRYMDAQIGLLLAHLKKAKLYDQSCFLVMGDHGEGLGEYQSHFGHIHYLNKAYTHVPFIVSGKNIPRRGAQRGLVSNFNVAPTLLDLIHAQKPKAMVGKSALDSSQDDRLFLETYSPEAYFDAFSVIRFPWQIVFYPGRPSNSLEFIDLQHDRFGVKNLIAEPDPSGQRAEMIRSVLEISRIITANKRNQDSLNKKTMDTLKSLGYL